MRKAFLRPATAANRSVNYADHDEFNYFEFICYTVGQSLLETGAGISKWGNFILKESIMTTQGSFSLLQSGARAITKCGRYFFTTQRSRYSKVGQVLLSEARLLQSGADITK